MKKHISIILTIIVLSTTACNDWLDIQPGTEQSSDEMFNTYQGYKDALIGCYMKMKERTLYGEKLTMTTIEFLAQHWDIESGYFNPSVDGLKRWDYMDDNVKTEIHDIYGALYNVIIQANKIILAIPKTGQIAIDNASTRAIIEGEAHAIRAFCHFDILRLFGQMPSNGSLQVSLPYSENASRNPVSYYDFNTFVDKIEQDLLKAEELLKDDPFIPYDRSSVNALGQTPNVVSDDFLRYRPLRLNYWAVKALQARFYLYVGNKEKAYTAAMTVINAQDETGKQKFTLQSLTTNSKYFALPDESLFTLNNTQMSNYISSLFYRTGTRICLYMDPTKLASDEMFGEVYSNATTNNRYKYLWDHETKNMYRKKCPVMLKYDQSDSQGESAIFLMLNKQIITLLRLSEVYLIAMEASLSAGGGIAEVNTLYETYRLARNILGTIFTNKDQVMDMIVKEYRRELFGEGQMFFTYKRLGKKTIPWTVEEGQKATETTYIIPLPTTEFDPNKK